MLVKDIASGGDALHVAGAVEAYLFRPSCYCTLAVFSIVLSTEAVNMPVLEQAWAISSYISTVIHALRMHRQDSPVCHTCQMQLVLMPAADCDL